MLKLSLFLSLTAVIVGAAFDIRAYSQGKASVDRLDERLTEHMRVSDREMGNLRIVESRVTQLEVESKTRLTKLEVLAESNTYLLRGIALALATLLTTSILALFKRKPVEVEIAP